MGNEIKVGIGTEFGIDRQLWYSKVLAEGRQTQRNMFSKCIFPICGQCQGLIYLKAIGMNINRLYNSNYICVSGNVTFFSSVFLHSPVNPICCTISQRKDVTSLRLQQLLLSCSHYFNRLTYWFHFLTISSCLLFSGKINSHAKLK